MEDTIAMRTRPLAAPAGDTAPESPAKLLIERFDHWTNPVGLNLGATMWCKVGECEDDA